eukprot:g26199.t1
MGRPAEEEQCFGCQCMATFPGPWLANGTFSKEYTCEDAKLQNLIPEFHWGGPKDFGRIACTCSPYRRQMWCGRFRIALNRPSLGPGAPLLTRHPDGLTSNSMCRFSGSYSRIMKRNRPPYIDFETGFPKSDPPKQTVVAAFTLAKQQKLEKLLEATPQKTFRGRVIKQLSTRRIRHAGRNDDIPATVLRIEYSPERTSHIALIQYQDGVLSYILAPLTLRPGDQVVASEAANIVPGNCLPLRNIPVGSIIHNIELRPGLGPTIRHNQAAVHRDPKVPIGMLGINRTAFAFGAGHAFQRQSWHQSLVGLAAIRARDCNGPAHSSSWWWHKCKAHEKATGVSVGYFTHGIQDSVAAEAFGFDCAEKTSWKDAKEVWHCIVKRVLSRRPEVPLLPGFRVDNRGTARFLLQISLVARWAKDLDYPNGMGSPDNVVHNIFWVANIPGDWMAINETAVVELSEFAPTMVVGRNSRGDRGMEPPCPEKGMHRYHVVMWSLDSQLDDIDSDISYGALKSLLEVHLSSLPL